VTARPLVVALALLAGGAALGILDTKPAAAEPDAATRAKASAHFKQGQAFFNRGDFDRALAEYQAAYEISAEPLLVFNMALCHDRAGRPEQALASFKRYLELAPEGTVADEAREDVARLTPIVDKLAADRAAEEARKRDEEAKKAQPPPPPKKVSAGSRSKVPLFIMIGGAAVAATGGVFHVLALQTRGRLEDGQDPDKYFDDRDSFRTQRAVAIGGYAVGAATVLTGLVLGVTVFRHREGVQVSAAPTSGGAMVTLGWSR
jgi:tetratricopeptide (TPR) repeat protein